MPLDHARQVRTSAASASAGVGAQQRMRRAQVQLDALGPSRSNDGTCGQQRRERIGRRRPAALRREYAARREQVRPAWPRVRGGQPPSATDFSAGADIVERATARRDVAVPSAPGRPSGRVLVVEEVVEERALLHRPGTTAQRVDEHALWCSETSISGARASQRASASASAASLGGRPRSRLTTAAWRPAAMQRGAHRRVALAAAAQRPSR